MEDLVELMARFDYWLEAALAAVAAATVALRRVRRALRAFGGELKRREGDDSG